MQPFLEHANITVTDIDEAVAFFRTAFPEFEIRGEGITGNGGLERRWLHIGTKDSYIALEEASESGEEHERYREPGINHLGFVISNLEAVAERMRKVGYKEGMSAMTHPHRKRIYFFDRDGNEFEFIEYLSADFAERNDYSL